MDIGKLLFTLSGYVKYKQFDFSFLVNGKYIELRRKFTHKNFGQFCFELEPKVRGCFLFTIYEVFFAI